ncbi:hypothetical protein C3K47_04135 [Solitalea longa]|uniref:Sulfatase-modifying factor enzyme-like domain-containing protein n=1 Tax=Solitalea longa TaxID=2079460 RepID=A0A2S5A8A9_9SPHI|nr:formylglycine-generating enzyme family protein [Solitalea longa]POY38592.1 hypothetical protein C3K47_04135 [Solitalea longa]
MKQNFILFLFLISNAVSAQTPVPEMISVLGGRFTMGSNSNDFKFDEKSTPTHTVTVSDFKMAKTETTVAQYRAFCKATGRKMPGWGLMADGKWESDNHPIVNVSFDEANAYCNWLSKKTGKKYRLPTEAEWEYAARGGKKSRGYKYSGGDDPKEVAWFSDTGGLDQAVGHKRPNELGLYDMSGNVYEWCNDWYGDYTAKAQFNPRGPASGVYRVTRGGGSINSYVACHVANRSFAKPDIRYFICGFRVVLVQ